MNTQVCTATGRTPYELVFGQAPRSNYALIKEVYDQGIRDEEDIPDNVEMQDNEDREEIADACESNDAGTSDNINELDDISIPESDRTPTPSSHEVFRKIAAENIQKNVERMRTIVRKRKRQITFSVGELVRINIPRIDRAGIDRKSLPCKVLETLDGGYYRLGCVFGVIERCYLAGEMETISAEFPELDKIPDTRISLTAASRLQSSAAAVNALCHCKSGCKNSRCACRRAGVACSSRCHSSISCTNKDN
jgi:hypothetical protein